VRVHLEYPVGEPTADVDGNNGENQCRDSCMRLGEGAGLVTLADTISGYTTKTEHHKSVEDRYDRFICLFFLNIYYMVTVIRVCVIS